MFFLHFSHNISNVLERVSAIQSNRIYIEKKNTRTIDKDQSIVLNNSKKQCKGISNGERERERFALMLCPVKESKDNGKIQTENIKPHPDRIN